MNKKQPPRIDDQLRKAIKASGLTHYAIAKLADVSPSQIDRFMTGERDLKLATAANLAASLGLSLGRG
jgi:plasmid maintenance system antidote protein VapI